MRRPLEQLFRIFCNMLRLLDLRKGTARLARAIRRSFPRQAKLWKSGRGPAKSSRYDGLSLVENSARPDRDRALGASVEKTPWFCGEAAGVIPNIPGVFLQISEARSARGEIVKNPNKLSMGLPTSQPKAAKGLNPVIPNFHRSYYDGYF